MLKGKENQSLQRKKETLETDSASTQILSWLDGELKITMINMLQAVTEKLDNTQEQMDNVSREMETITNNQKEILQIKKHCNRDEDTTKERKVDLEDITIETSKTEKQREKTNQKKTNKQTKNQNRIPRAVRQLQLILEQYKDLGADSLCSQKSAQNFTFGPPYAWIQPTVNCEVLRHIFMGGNGI